MWLWRGLLPKMLSRFRELGVLLSIWSDLWDDFEFFCVWVWFLNFLFFITGFIPHILYSCKDANINYGKQNIL
jgi:hypothetical protein